MYVILVENDNTLKTTKVERIMQRSKLVDSLCFLVYPDYHGYDMSSFSVLLEYVLPISKKYESDILELSKDMYKGYLKYTLPFDTKLTSEAGDIELTLSFVLSDLDENGNSIQRVRKVSGTSVKILPVTSWSDVIPDSALSALDQRLIKLDAQMKGLNDFVGILEDKQVDNLIYDEGEETLQLSSNGVGVGDKVSIKNMIDDGIPVVDLNHGDGSNDDEDVVDDDNVVEF